MTIINGVNEITEFDSGEPQVDLNLPKNKIPDISVLQTMVNEYFPEFFAPDISADKQSSIQEVVSNPVQTINAISDDLKVDDYSYFPESNGINQSIMVDEKAQFSFLEDARSIFTTNSNRADNQAKYELQGKIPANRIVEMVPGKGFRESSSSIAPLLVPAMEYSSESFDVDAIRKDFPILSEQINGKNLVWLDNAATTQKPKSVIERLIYFYEHENSNVHRGAHTLAARSTDAYEGARAKISRFLNAYSDNEIVFVRGTTEAINLVAHSWGKYNLQQGDEIIITWLEHHANIVPWQMICSETGAKLRVVPVDETGQIILAEYEKCLGPKTKIVGITHVSNALGTVTPVAEMVHLAHKYGAKVLVDGAQAVSHLKVDVQALDCDFYVFSGHKIFGPPGVGVLYAKGEVLNAMRPYQGGGNMITDVTFEKTAYQAPPHRFEAGTGNIAGAIGLGAAIDYVNSVGLGNITRYEHNLLAYGMEALQQISGLRLIGTANQKTSVLSFALSGITTEAIGKALSDEGIAVRAGHHCAQPILRRFGLESVVRPSLAFYNTCGEIDMLVAVLRNLKDSRSFGKFSSYKNG